MGKASRNGSDNVGHRQVAAVPVRRRRDGRLEILLVTSRGTKRWIVPKGWPWPDRADHQAAAEEAREEAGIVGRVRRGPLGTYVYTKRRRTGALVEVKVRVFQIEVQRLMRRWLEKDQRVRRWFTIDAAAAAVTEPDLKEIILRLGRRQDAAQARA